ncbi:hypothetical protein [Methylobacterium nigriterrae]|uniref:hypothetical protein n=1 Tax=Methylobacterium nigriterrae TaxID=3127512 RepID=UPI003013FBF3
MRTIMQALIGLLGTALSVASAEARSCPRTYSVEDVGSVMRRPVKRPDLVGKTMREIRRAGGRRWSAVEVAYRAERFTVRYDVTPRATPAVMGFSWKGSTAPNVSWAQHAPSDDVIGATIEDGPLSGFTLTLDPCE